MRVTHGGACHSRHRYVFFLCKNFFRRACMFILQIVIILLATKIAGQLSIRLGQPSVLGKIIVGIILGPALLGWVQGTEIISIFSQIGVLLLMFLAGLETNLKDINQNKKAAISLRLAVSLHLFY